MWRQVGLRKHHYEQSWWRWWNPSWPISSPKRWCCESGTFKMSANLENSAVATGLEKVTFHSNPKEGQCQRMVKLIVLISHASKVTLKTFQARLQLAWTENFQMYKLGLKKAEESEIKLPAFIWSWRKQENSRKISASATLSMPRFLTMWSTTNCGKFSKRRENQTTLLSPKKSVCRSRSNS